MTKKTLDLTPEEKILVVQQALEETGCSISVTPMLQTSELTINLSETFNKSGIIYKISIVPPSQEQPLPEEEGTTT
jgi:hypothetical protein